jgi:D-alanyl-lipoteichoic acid acyltransferase DltB (MBOAT superfamily)
MGRIPFDLFVQSLIAGFAVIATPAGIVFVGLVVVLGLIGITLHSRVPGYLGAFLTLGVFLLNLHILAIFPLDNVSRALISMTVLSSNPMQTKLYGLVGKVFYNFGFLLMPFVLSIVGMELVVRPPKKGDEGPYSK